MVKHSSFSPELSSLPASVVSLRSVTGLHLSETGWSLTDGPDLYDYQSADIQKGSKTKIDSNQTAWHSIFKQWEISTFKLKIQGKVWISMYFELYETKRISMDRQAVCQHSPEMNHQCRGVLMIANSKISMHCELYETKTFSMDRVAGLSAFTEMIHLCRSVPTTADSNQNETIKSNRRCNKNR